MTHYDQALIDELTSLGQHFGTETVALAAVSLASDDEVEVYQREDGEFGWRLQSAGNNEGIATPGEGYGDKSHAVAMARRVTHREPVDRT